jgi:peptidoglycan/xylan/chitin deacetylase (PgdA/CDA1 family)
MEVVARKPSQRLFKIAAFIVYHVGAPRLFAWIANRYHLHSETSRSVVSQIIKRQSRNVQILVYHRVNDDRDSFFEATPVRIFARQMEYLARNYNVCALEEAVDGIKCGNLPENAIVVTFDDGYKDNFVNAYPILKKFSIPATIFLATDAIGTGKALWHDRVFSAFRVTRQMFLDGIGDDSQRYPLRTLDDKILAQKKVLQFLWSIDHQNRLSWVERLIQQLAVPEEVQGSHLMLTWDDVQTMHQNGISFGSHTLSHPILTRMAPADARREIYASKRAIEDVLGSSATAFAYPVGRKEDFDQSIKGMVKEAGYLCALTTIFGTNDSRQDFFELKRGNPWEVDVPSFAIKLSWYKFTT